jgi:hypothetical protein
LLHKSLVAGPDFAHEFFWVGSSISNDFVKPDNDSFSANPRILCVDSVACVKDFLFAFSIISLLKIVSQRLPVVFDGAGDACNH